MNVWLCPIKARGWQKIKKLGVFGAPSQVTKLMSKVKANDLLIFHIIRPVNGIVGVAKVISEVYIDNSDLWGKDRYPVRVRVNIISILDTDRAIPLDTLFGVDPKSEFSISPFLKNTWIAPLTVEHYKNIENCF